MTELTDFCRRVTAVEQDGDKVIECYLRMRAGQNRKGSTVIASGISCTGEPAVSLERTLIERLDTYGDDESIWIECLARNSNQIRDTIKIPKAELAPEIQPVDSMLAVVGRLSDALVSMANNADMRAERALAGCTETQGAFLRTFQEWALAKAELEHQAPASEMGQAMEMLGAMAPAIAARLGASPQQVGQEVTPEDQADLLVEHMVGLAQAHPEIITSDRMSRLSQIIRVGPTS